jgi:hypothetical protein
MTACTKTEGLGIPVAFKMVGKPHTPIADTRPTRASRGYRVAMRQMMEDVMAKVIEFYIPDLFSKQVSTARGERGKVIEFCLPRVKAPVLQFREPAPREMDAKAGAIPMWGFCI